MKACENDADEKERQVWAGHAEETWGEVNWRWKRSRGESLGLERCGADPSRDKIPDIEQANDEYIPGCLFSFSPVPLLGPPNAVPFVFEL